MRAWIGAAAVLAALLWTGTARAQDVSPAQAQALEGQIRGWLVALLGPRVELTARPVRLTAEDGRYSLAMPVSTSGTFAIAGPDLTATMRPLEAGRWALDDIRLPSPLRIATTLPEGHHSESTITLRDQHFHAIIDPSVASTSTWDGSVSSAARLSHGLMGERRTETGPATTHIAWQPAGAGGRLDVIADSTTDLMASNATLPSGRKVAIGIANLRANAHVDGLLPGQAASLLRVAMAAVPLMTAMDARHPNFASPDLDRLRGMAADAAAGLLSAAGEQATLRDVHVKSDGVDATAGRVELGTEMAAPDGVLALRLHLAADDIGSADLPAGLLHDYLPRHLALSPRLDGIPTALFFDMLRVGSDGGPSPQTMQRLQDAAHPVSFGIDDFAADFGPATLAGAGRVTLAAAGVTGQARITMTGLDALIRDARSVPMLKQALPVLIFLKGIGEPQGNAVVWVIDYSDRRVTVNGTDLSQMMPGVR